MSESRKARRPHPIALVKPDGSYNLAAIMGRAIRHARRYPSLRCWPHQMAVTLRHVWSLAKIQRLAGAH
jgi:hypothetical protein